MKKRGFTLIELLVVISIISLLTSIILSSLSDARKKARDSRRAQDMVQIYNALNLYYDKYGCLPQPLIPAGTANQNCNTQSNYKNGTNDNVDYSNTAIGANDSGFMIFLEESGFMPKVPVDPINSTTSRYKYACFPPTSASAGLRLIYTRESDNQEINKNVINNITANTDKTFTCK